MAPAYDFMSRPAKQTPLASSDANDRRIRLKKQPPQPSSPWTTKGLPRTKMDSDEDDFSGEDDKKKNSSIWTDVTTKKKIANDPFAGMDAFVDYQKEIERLKALVPKVETKKRPNGRPKSTGADTNRSLRGGLDGYNRSLPSKADSALRNHRHTTISPASRSRPMSSIDLSLSGASTPRSTSPTTSEHSISTSQTSSLSENTMMTTTTDDPQTREGSCDNELAKAAQATSVISEEERIRFLEFVRSWTGGWKRWEGNGVTDLTDAGSLWARQTPWTCTVDRPYRPLPVKQDPLIIAKPMFCNVSNPSMEKQTPFWPSSSNVDMPQDDSSNRPLPSYSLLNYDQQQSSRQSLHDFSSSPLHLKQRSVGIIGDKYQVTATSHGKTPFGVFTM